MKRKSKIQEAIDWLSWAINARRETAYDEEKTEELEFLRVRLTKQKRMTDFQRKKLEWLQSL